MDRLTDSADVFDIDVVGGLIYLRAKIILRSKELDFCRKTLTFVSGAYVSN